MRDLSLHLLGYPRLLRGGARVRLDRRKALALLASVAMGGGRSSRDELIARLWPTLDTPRARRALRRTLFEVTREAGEAFLDRGDEIVLDPRVLWCDAVELLDASAPDAPLSALERARALHGRSFLQGFAIRNAPGFEDWQAIEVERLRARFVSVLERLLQRYAAAGRHDAALECARRLLQEEPYHELAHRAVMELSGRQGRPASAVAQYERYESLLRDELDLEPSPQMRLLRDRLRADTSLRDRGGAGPQPALRELAERVSEAAEAFDFCGRYEEGDRLLAAALASLPEEHDLAGKLRIRRAVLQISRGTLTAARDGLLEGTSRLRGGADRAELAYAWNRLGYVTFALGDEADGLRSLACAVAAYRELGSSSRLAWSLNVLGHVSIHTERAGTARAHIEESLALASELGETGRVASALNSLGKLLREEGKLEASREVLEQSLRLREGLGHRIGASDSLNNLGDVAAAAGDSDEAMSFYGRALAAAVAIEALPLVMEILVGVAERLAARGELTDAVSLLTRAGEDEACWADARRRARERLSRHGDRLARSDFTRAQVNGRAMPLRQLAERYAS